jgi:hypothetical protein
MELRMAMSQKEHDIVTITKGKRKLARMAEPEVVRVRVPDLLDRRGSRASWIVGVVGPIKARNGFH